MPAEVEEIVINADVSHAERSLPHLRDALLQQRDRRVMLGAARRRYVRGATDQRQRDGRTALRQRQRR